MLTRALARPVTAAAGLACLATFALAGCSGQGDDAGDGPVTRATSSSSPATGETTAGETAGETTSGETAGEPTTGTATETTAPQDTASTTSAPPHSAGLRGRLLGPREVPGFNQEYRWAQGATRGREPAQPFGTCQRFAMTSIGATAVAVRTFRPAVAGATDSAAELVAEFPDTTTARRAFEVLKAWRGRCAGQLRRYDRSDVGALVPVGVEGGTGGWYLLRYGPVPGDPDAGYFDAQGMAVLGARIAMVELVAVGQDYNYERGQEPAVAAVQRAAAKLH